MYKIIDDLTIQKISTGATFPKDAGNRDYRDYLEWLLLGNTPVPADVRLPTAAELRHDDAINQAALATALKSVNATQAENYVFQQITNGVSENAALAAFDGALTFAAAKPVLRNMLVGMYRTVDVLKLIARILVALRDATWPDLPER
jgi:hypothetical protein